jgi:hypothetical protein
MSVKNMLVLSGQENRNQIVVDASASIKYFAVSYPGADPEEAVWLCSKQVSSGSDYPFVVTTFTYPEGEDPVLSAPGVDGVDLAALFGD